MSIKMSVVLHRPSIRVHRQCRRAQVAHNKDLLTSSIRFPFIQTVSSNRAATPVGGIDIGDCNQLAETYQRHALV